MNRFEKHIDQLCCKYKISWQRIEGRKCFGAFTENRCIVTSTRITTFARYAAALHEIGHILNYRKKFYNQSIWSRKYNRITRFTLWFESVAWKTAKELAGKNWNSKMIKERDYCLHTYFLALQKQQGQPVNYNVIHL